MVSRENTPRAIAQVAVIVLLSLLGCQRSKAQRVDESGNPASMSSTSRKAQAKAAPTVERWPDGRPKEAPPHKKLTGKLDVTFLVASDTHVGYGASDDPFRDPLVRPTTVENTNLRMIESMNRVEGHGWPTALGGTVGRPRAVLVSGDLTERGSKVQWDAWTRMFGLRGSEGALKLPVFEGAGNHDRISNWYVREQVAKRHGGRHYFFDWDDLRVVCLGEAPGEAGLEVLQAAFDSADDDVPFVLFFHNPLQGEFSDNWFTQEGHHERLAQSLSGRRVLGIFHGHFHATMRYEWRGIDVYNVGSPKYLDHSYSIAHVTNDRIRVAEWNYDKRRYSWWHDERTGSTEAGAAR